MRPDQLLVITQGVRGGKHHSNLQGQVKAVVKKGYNESENSITIDVFKGSGHTYEPTETAKINISFADSKEWNGNFENLKDKIFSSKPNTATYKQIEAFAADTYTITEYGRETIGASFLLLEHNTNDITISFILTGYNSAEGNIYTCIYSDIQNVKF